MTPHKTAIGLMAIALFTTALRPAMAQDTEQDGPMPEVRQALDSGRTPAAATIELIMDQAVRNIAIRYSLNDVQTDKTSQLMKRDVYRFLKDNEDAVWPVIRDLLQSQLQAPDDPVTLKRVGQAAGRLMAKVKESIMRGNEEWRLILNDEQRKVHDFDLGEMETTFEQIEWSFSEWTEGRRPPGGIIPQPSLAHGGPRPTRPEAGVLPKPERDDMFDPKHILEVQAEAFIKEYHLEKSQITAARSIVEEFKTRADEFRDANKEAFAQVATDLKEARENRDLKKMKAAYLEQKKLVAPLSQVCDAMHARLLNLLTTAQIQRHESRRAVRKSDTPKPKGRVSAAGDKSKAEVAPPATMESEPPDSR